MDRDDRPGRSRASERRLHHQPVLERSQRTYAGVAQRVGKPPSDPRRVATLLDDRSTLAPDAGPHPWRRGTVILNCQNQHIHHSWFPNSVWKPASRNSVSTLILAKRSFADKAFPTEFG